MKLWPFCELFYGRKSVEVLCLEMQNQHEVNVGLVVWLCWHAVHRRFVGAELFYAAKKEALGEHQLLIESLRKVRKSPSVKALADCKAISGHVLAAEILLEKTILEQLEFDFKVPEAACESDVFGLLEYLTECRVADAKQATTFLYASAAACIT